MVDSGVIIPRYVHSGPPPSWALISVHNAQTSLLLLDQLISLSLPFKSNVNNWGGGVAMSETVVNDVTLMCIRPMKPIHRINFTLRFMVLKNGLNPLLKGFLMLCFVL